MKRKKFIVAVSGGVDSSVLLHKLMQNKPEYVEYVVAHVDHNVRPYSSKDAEFVEKMALKYNLLFCQTVLRTTKKDEDSLREKRYEFLFKLKDQYNAESIITAHHQDDVIETMIINLIRGTSPRGLSPMNRAGILRPLINSTKTDLLQYAKENKVLYVEDETNEDETYLRNYVRKNIMPKLSQSREQLLKINKTISELYEDIDIRVDHLVPKRNVLSRAAFVRYPHVVAKEVMRAWLLSLGVDDVDSRMIESAVVASKTLPRGKKIDIGKNYWLKSEKEVVQLIKKL